jgi:phosphoserine aminotransferase
LDALHARADANTAVLTEWVARTPWVDFLVAEPSARSNTSVCLKIVDPRVTSLSTDAQADFAKALTALLEKHNVALDAAAYRTAPAGLRLWCGATVEQSDLQALVPWLDWAFATCASQLSN